MSPPRQEGEQNPEMEAARALSTTLRDLNNMACCFQRLTPEETKKVKDILWVTVLEISKIVSGAIRRDAQKIARASLVSPDVLRIKDKM